jgi:hypothetical protein
LVASGGIHLTEADRGATLTGAGAAFPPPSLPPYFIWACAHAGLHTNPALPKPSSSSSSSSALYSLKA